MNQLSQPELWEKIQTFQIDDPASTFPFSKKLAQENNWTLSLTNRAIEEYKKFIYLCCISPNGASPSAIVDEVWHMHLTYTDNYWNAFCKSTLLKDIHHHPSKGGSAEKHKHVNWYAATLSLYEKEFNHIPPADIWPAEQSASIDIEADIYEPGFLKTLVTLFIAAVVIYVTVFNLFRTKGPDFLTYYLVLCIGGLITLYIMQQHKDDLLKLIIKDHLPQKYTPFQMARFLYGSHRCYQTALVDLLKRAFIETSGKNYIIVWHQLQQEAGEVNPLLQPLMQNYKMGDVFTYNDGLGLIDRDTVLHPDLERLHRLSDRIDYPKFIVPGIVLLIGFARLLQGLANDKPVEFLVVEMIAFGMLSLALLESFSYTKTVRGYIKDYWLDENSNGYGNNIINNFTIHGTDAITSFTEYTVLTEVFAAVSAADKKSANDGSAGCGSSGGCSGGGDGGGCGSGCGGCGGD
jgi:uncharacterized protein (TIGR04222 family)